jgi:hypothetical protein
MRVVLPAPDAPVKTMIAGAAESFLIKVHSLLPSLLCSQQFNATHRPYCTRALTRECSQDLFSNGQYVENGEGSLQLHKAFGQLLSTCFDVVRP